MILWFLYNRNDCIEFKKYYLQQVKENALDVLSFDALVTLSSSLVVLA